MTEAMTADQESIDIPKPVLARRLKAAREAAQLRQQQVADALTERGHKMLRTTLVAIEQGKRAVRPAELVEFADLYGTSVSSLVSAVEPPAEMVVQLRANRAANRDSAELAEQAVRAMRDACDDYLRLEAIVGVQPPTIDVPWSAHGDLPAEVAAEDAATRERARLGLGDAPVLDVRSLLELELGARTFMLDLPSTIAGAFARTDTTGLVIAANAKHRFERQRWSMCHEWGHALDASIDAEVTPIASRSTSRSERYADAFAKYMLMPTSGVRRRAMQLRADSGRGQLVGADIVRLAEYFQVAVEAMTLRLEELKLVAGGTWTRFNDNGFRADEARRALGFELRQPDTDRMPPRFRNLAIDGYRRGAISEGQLARLFRADRLEMRELVDAASSLAATDHAT